MGGGGQNTNLLTYETLVHAISGAAGSVVSMATFFPLDTVRSRLQLEEGRVSKSTLATIRELVAKEGPLTLYRGMVPVLQSLCASNFVYFYTFHGLKTLRNRRNQTAGNDLLVASIAGIINVLTTTPLWVVNTKLKMRGIEQVREPNNNEYNTLYDGLVHMWKYEGIKKLWAGTLPSLALVANPAIQFMTYESIKRRVFASFNGLQPPAWTFFVIGAVAKAVATALTYPLQLVQAQLRHGHKFQNLPPNAGTLQILLYILKKQGILGLYKGMEAKLLQTVLTAALMFLSYEKISRFIFPGTAIESHPPRKSNRSASPVAQTRETASEWNDKLAERCSSVDRHSLTLKKIECRSSKAILRLWNKLKPRRDTRKQVEPDTRDSVVSVCDPSHAEETMSARSQRGIHETSTTKQYRSPRAGVKKRCAKEQITYDYDAAVSQPDVPHLLELKKNGRCPMKRSQTHGLKSRCKRNANSRPPDGNGACRSHGGVASSGVSDEEGDVGEKENVTSNGTVDVDTASNFFKKNMTGDGQNASCKDATLEVVETSDKNPVTEKKVKIESPTDCENAAAKSPVLQVKGSRIPRAKVAAFPVHTPQECPPAKKVTICNAKDPTQWKSSTTTCTPNNADTEQLQTIKGSCDEVQEQIIYKQEVVRFKAIRRDSKTVWNEERASETDGDEEVEGDRGLTSADESTAIIGNVDDPRVLTILRNLKLNCPCKSCTDHEPPPNNQREDDSDLKSSSPEEDRRKKWFKSLKHRKYAGTSSEDVCASSDANSEKSRRKKRSRFRVKSPLSQRAKTSSMVHATPKISSHRRASFSFFNTLFDIVFWPYVFLKANR